MLSIKFLFNLLVIITLMAASISYSQDQTYTIDSKNKLLKTYSRSLWISSEKQAKSLEGIKKLRLYIASTLWEGDYDNQVMSYIVDFENHRTHITDRLKKMGIEVIYSESFPDSIDLPILLISGEETSLGIGAGYLVEFRFELLQEAKLSKDNSIWLVPTWSVEFCNYLEEYSGLTETIDYYLDHFLEDYRYANKL